MVWGLRPRFSGIVSPSSIVSLRLLPILDGRPSSPDIKYTVLHGPISVGLWFKLGFTTANLWLNISKSVGVLVRVRVRVCELSI